MCKHALLKTRNIEESFTLSDNPSTDTSLLLFLLIFLEEFPPAEHALVLLMKCLILIPTCLVKCVATLAANERIRIEIFETNRA